MKLRKPELTRPHKAERERHGEYQGTPKDRQPSDRSYLREGDRVEERSSEEREARLDESKRDYARERGYPRGSFEGHGPEGETRSVYGPGGYGGEERGWWQRWLEKPSSWFRKDQQK